MDGEDFDCRSKWGFSSYGVSFNTSTVAASFNASTIINNDVVEEVGDVHEEIFPISTATPPPTPTETPPVSPRSRENQLAEAVELLNLRCTVSQLLSQLKEFSKTINSLRSEICDLKTQIRCDADMKKADPPS